MARLGTGLARIFARSGQPISKRLADLLDLACDTLSMDAGFISLAKDGDLAPRIYSASVVAIAEESDQAFLASCLRGKSTVLTQVPDGFVDWRGRRPARYLGAPIIFDGRFYGTIEFSSDRRCAREPFAIELSMVQVIGAYAAVPLVLLAGDI